MQFNKQNLEQAGFVGWIPLLSVRSSSCPSCGGVYVISYTADEPVTFTENSCGGWFKRRNPTVTQAALIANWVDGSEVVYIGKANQLMVRLRQFADFGMGKPIGHWGGRLIWQLADINRLLVAWKETPGRNPREVEVQLIEEFQRDTGKRPFANDPHRLGK